MVPDRIVLGKNGFLRTVEAGRKHHRDTCAHGVGGAASWCPTDEVNEPCLTPGEAVTLGRLLRKCETLAGGRSRSNGRSTRAASSCCNRGRCMSSRRSCPTRSGCEHPGLNGHPAGIGWGSGRAVVVNCECEIERVGAGRHPGDAVAGPALSHILPRVAGVVAELGGSTSHLASLARERGIPMVLGVLDATRKIPDGAQCAVDGVAGVVRWHAMSAKPRDLRHAAGRRERDRSGCAAIADVMTVYRRRQPDHRRSER